MPTGSSWSNGPGGIIADLCSLAMILDHVRLPKALIIPWKIKRLIVACSNNLFNATSMIREGRNIFPAQKLEGRSKTCNSLS